VRAWWLQGKSGTTASKKEKFTKIKILALSTHVLGLALGYEWALDKVPGAQGADMAASPSTLATLRRNRSRLLSRLPKGLFSPHADTGFLNRRHRSPPPDTSF